MQVKLRMIKKSLDILAHKQQYNAFSTIGR